MTTKLLVSVRNAEEALLAKQCQVDIIDLKEPERGSLGLVAWNVAEQVAQTIQNSPPLSLAMGELFADSDYQIRQQYTETMLEPFTYAKVGMAGAQAMDDWRLIWSDWSSKLPKSTKPVLVGYVDPIAGGPDLDSLFNFAAEKQIGTVLLDTYLKNGKSLLDHMSIKRLQSFRQFSRKHRIRLALAGSLQGPSFLQALELRSDILAVRTAACVSERNGKLCASRILDLKKSVSQQQPTDRIQIRAIPH